MSDSPNTEIPEGPYLAAAILCEAVLQESSGYQSLIRIIDQATFGLTRERTPGETVPFQTNLFLLFRAGNYEGEATIDIQPTDPSGNPLRRSSTPILLQGQRIGPHSGATITVSLNLGLHEPGVYWFNVFLDDRFMTRVPLRVVFEQAATGVEGESVGASAPQ